MSLIIALGSNLDEPLKNLNLGFLSLCEFFRPKALSRTYHSKAVGYVDQPDFYNQVVEFESTQKSPLEVLNILMEIERKHGRMREIQMGPRTLDLDLIFFDDLHMSNTELTLPHPRLWTRSFVVLPLRELPAYETLCKKFKFDQSLEGNAEALAGTHTSFF